MPLPFVSVPAFPAVLPFPGVPNLLRLGVAQLPLPVTAVADALGIGALLGEQWGLFPVTSGAPSGFVASLVAAFSNAIQGNAGSAIVGDSVVAVDFSRDYVVSDYPLQVGSFDSYNKVAQPFDVRITFTIGTGPIQIAAAVEGVTARAQFLETVDAACASTNLYTALTPEKQYQNLNPVHYDYRREARRGVTLIHVDVWCKEIRIAAPTPLSNGTTQSPNGVDPQSGGYVSLVKYPITGTPLAPPT